MMHVLEHLTQPDLVLKDIFKNLHEGGKIIVEVPHAYDILLDTFDLDEFKGFTYWSEHLALYTRDSLRRLMEYCGFKNIVIQGIQRHGIGNHLYWLRHGKPGGHNVWKFLETDDLNKEYEKVLNQYDKTDTIIAIGEKL
jgi:predicted SAM-dependent methyltransferase